ncbi:MAG: DNA polymerase I, partial [Cytophagales bacterium]|nr:DNA polymerase I [Cytophagales bacterium]
TPTESKELKNINTSKHDYHIVDTPELQDDLVRFLLLQDEICFDSETDSLEAHDAAIVGLSFCYLEKEAYYVPFPTDEKQARVILERFRPVFENESIGKIGQNIKYDITVLKSYGIEVKGPIFDTMLAHYLIEPDMRHGMDYLAETYLDYSPVSITELIGKKGNSQGNMRDVPVDQIAEYAAEDADITFRLKNIFAPMIQKSGLNHLFETVECPLVNVLSDMEIAGVKIDVEALRESSSILEKDIREYEKRVFELAGEEFNVASPKQLGIILFEKLKLDPKAKKTATGQYATGEEVLSKLAYEHEIAAKILEYRELQKLKSTYVDALPALISPEDHRVHTSYNQAVAATGRLSSTNPNLQNIPIRTERGKEIRKAFIP